MSLAEAAQQKNKKKESMANIMRGYTSKLTILMLNCANSTSNTKNKLNPIINKTIPIFFAPSNRLINFKS